MRFRAWTDSAFSVASRLALTLLALVVVAASLVVAVPHVDATTGVDDYPPRLKRAAQDSLVDPWLFYNRECTSFVAWRLNNAGGVAFNNYFLGEHWGDASNWSYAAQQAGLTVDDNPTRGSIAWWRKGSPGSSRGHVAWVESASAGQITIEEYNYLYEGGYDTRTIASTSSMWPSGFIHVRNLALRNVQNPTITGVAQVGTRLTAIRGAWSPTADGFTYRWFGDGKAIPDATKKWFTPTPDQLGEQLRVRVTATKDGLKPAAASSTATAKVILGAFSTTAAPAVSGIPQVGIPLTATSGTWSPIGAYRYQWYAGGEPIAGATDPTFTPTANELNSTLTVKVTATRDGYKTATVSSLPTPAVLPGLFSNQKPPTIDGTAQVGERLTASPGDWTPAGTPSYQWFSAGAPVAGATRASYQVVAADLHHQITVQVTEDQTGYTPATLTSAATESVVAGELVNTHRPTTSGTPQVGVTLTADPGTWSPKAGVTYQWLADGKAVSGATDPTFVPTPAQAGQAIAVQVTASRPGYVTAVATSPSTDPVALGIITNVAPPTVTGRARVGAELTASAGTWSLTPETVSYQWRRDGIPIAGATASTYAAVAADGGHRISVRVRVTADGYHAASSMSAPVDVLFGQVTFNDDPHVRGRTVVGRTLTVVTGGASPSDAQATYRWYRGIHLIRSADGATYELRGRDKGYRISVRVTLSAPGWAPVTRRTPKTTVVEAPRG